MILWFHSMGFKRVTLTWPHPGKAPWVCEKNSQMAQLGFTRIQNAGVLAAMSTGLIPAIHLLDMSGRVVCASEAVVAAGSSQAVLSPPNQHTLGF